MFDAPRVTGLLSDAGWLVLRRRFSDITARPARIHCEHLGSLPLPNAFQWYRLGIECTGQNVLARGPLTAGALEHAA